MNSGNDNHRESTLAGMTRGALRLRRLRRDFLCRAWQAANGLRHLAKRGLDVVAALVSLGTVYLGEQVMPLLFLLLGWSEATLQRAPATAAAGAADVAPGTAARTTPRFRVIR